MNKIQRPNWHLNNNKLKNRKSLKKMQSSKGMDEWHFINIDWWIVMILYWLIQISHMNIGVAVAIFLTLSILLMALFCFVTKYFNYKLKKALEDKNEVYSMV